MSLGLPRTVTMATGDLKDTEDTEASPDIHEEVPGLKFVWTLIS